MGDTLSIRYVLWDGTVRLIKDNFVFGAGLDGFKELYSEKYKYKYAEDLQYPHNIILNFWTETGLLGLLSFLGMLIYVSGIVINRIIKIFKINQHLFFGIVIALMFTYWIIHGFVDVPYFKNDLSLEFWSIMALFTVWKRNLIPQESQLVQDWE